MNHDLLAATDDLDDTGANDTIVRRGKPRLNVHLLLGVVVSVVALSFTWTIVDYRLFQFAQVGAWAIAMLGLNLLTGYNGQISLGHGAFFGLGAYTVAIAVREWGMVYPATFVLAFVVCFVIGALLGIPALRLPGISLALITLGIALAFPQVLRKYDTVTGGVQGIITPQERQLNAPDWTNLTNDQFRYLVVVIVGIIMFWLAWNLTRGRWGLAMMSIRDNPLSAVSMGVNQATTKVITFGISAGYAGVGGALFAMIFGFMAPENVTLLVSISLLAGIVIGGLGTVAGAVIGGFFYVFMPNYATNFSEQAPGVVYGVIIILVMLVAPGGVLGLVRKGLDMLQRRIPALGRVLRRTDASTVDQTVEPSASTHVLTKGE